MRLIFIILGIVSAIVALALSILPFGLIALLPAVIAFICGLIAFSVSKKEGKSKRPVQLIFLVTIIALVLTTYRSLFNENTIETDTEFIEKEKVSDDDLKELEGLDTNGGSSD